MPTTCIPRSSKFTLLQTKKLFYTLKTYYVQFKAYISDLKQNYLTDWSTHQMSVEKMIEKQDA